MGEQVVTVMEGRQDPDKYVTKANVPHQSSIQKIAIWVVSSASVLALIIFIGPFVLAAIAALATVAILLWVLTNWM